MRIRNFSTALSAATLLFATCAAHAAPKVVASLVQPPGGLSCTDAAERTQVVFDFQRPRKDLEKVSVFVNGEGVREEDVTQDWPKLRVMDGLHPGRNTVEVFATDRKGNAIAHELVVLIGEKPVRDERDVAIVDCSGRLATRDPQRDDPAGEMLDWNGEVVDEELEEDVEDVEYRAYDGPVYVYHPYPYYHSYRYAPVYYYAYPYYGYYPRTRYRHYEGDRGRAWDRREAPRQHWSGPQHSPRTMSSSPAPRSGGSAWQRRHD